jgi:hypothetical protein
MKGEGIPQCQQISGEHERNVGNSVAHNDPIERAPDRHECDHNQGESKEIQPKNITAAHLVLVNARRTPIKGEAATNPSAPCLMLRCCITPAARPNTPPTIARETGRRDPTIKSRKTITVAQRSISTTLVVGERQACDFGIRCAKVGPLQWSNSTLSSFGDIAFPRRRLMPKTVVV